jgi:cephalosporin-C deacetylase-like acetyl esterase
LPDEVYYQLRTGALSGYWNYRIDSREHFYYRRVYLGCVRSNDFLTSRENWNGEELLVMGGSQGGQLTIVTSALDERVTALAANYPAFCDVTGPLSGRAGGWPKMFQPNKEGVTNVVPTEDVLNTTSYYDVVNFARRLTVPGFYGWGYNDVTCPPTSLYAAYNVITAPKELALLLQMGHRGLPELYTAVRDWVSATLELE